MNLFLKNIGQKSTPFLTAIQFQTHFEIVHLVPKINCKP